MAIATITPDMSTAEPASEQLLIAAVLHQVVKDVRHTHAAKQGRVIATLSLTEQLDALEWLLSGQELCFFAGVLGLEETYLRQQLIIVRLAWLTPPRGSAHGMSADPRQSRARLHQHHGRVQAPLKRSERGTMRLPETALQR